MRTELALPSWIRPESTTPEILASRVIAAALAALAVAAGIWLRNWKVGLGLGSIPTVLLAATLSVEPPGMTPSRRQTPDEPTPGGLTLGAIQAPETLPPAGLRRYIGLSAAHSRPDKPLPIAPAAGQSSVPHTDVSSIRPVPAEPQIDLSPIAPLVVGDTQVTVVMGSITDQRVDVIVNAANSALVGGGGVDAAILAAAGQEPYDECARLYPAGCPEGQARWTGPGRLAQIGVKGIAHAVGPIWGGKDSPDLLRQANIAALELAESNGMVTVALPFLSTGAFLAPMGKAAPIVVQAIVDHLRAASAPTTLREVRFAVIAKAIPHFRAAFEAIRPTLRSPAQPAEQQT